MPRINGNPFSAFLKYQGLQAVLLSIFYFDIDKYLTAFNFYPLSAKLKYYRRQH
jgi:hypothetical protein